MMWAASSRAMRKERFRVEGLGFRVVGIANGSNLTCKYDRRLKNYQYYGSIFLV